MPTAQKLFHKAGDGIAANVLSLAKDTFHTG
jgi:hypothetical protein